MQCAPSESHHGALDTFRKIVRNEVRQENLVRINDASLCLQGILALYKGVTPQAVGWGIIDSVLLGSPQLPVIFSAARHDWRTSHKPAPTFNSPWSWRCWAFCRSNKVGTQWWWLTVVHPLSYQCSDCHALWITQGCVSRSFHSFFVMEIISQSNSNSSPKTQLWIDSSKDPLIVPDK